MAKQNLIGALPIFHLLDAASICPICGRAGRHYGSVYPSNADPFRYFVLVWCERCGSGWLPDAERVMKYYYEAAYAAITERDKMEPSIVLSSENLVTDARYQRAVAQVERLKAHGAEFDATYDFGFGLGFFLQASGALRKWGFDIDPHTRAFAEHLGIERIAPFEISAGSIGCLMSSHAIEHIAAECLDPHLAAFYRLLKPGGLFGVEVPHAALSWLVKPGAHRPHTIFFSAEGLEMLLRRHGFEIVERGFAADGPLAELSANPVYRPDATHPYFSSRNTAALLIVSRKPSFGSSGASSRCALSTK